MAKQTESVRIDVKVLAKARIAASYKHKQVGEYISDILRPIADRDIEAEHAALVAPPQVEKTTRGKAPKSKPSD
jgi:hypothetical protein